MGNHGHSVRIPQEYEVEGVWVNGVHFVKGGAANSDYWRDKAGERQREINTLRRQKEQLMQSLADVQQALHDKDQRILEVLRERDEAQGDLKVAYERIDTLHGHLARSTTRNIERARENRASERVPGRFRAHERIERRAR